jgi:hypothetical protein
VTLKETKVGLGGSIFFLVVGAICVFAVTPSAKKDVTWIDLTALGWIFILAGVVGIVLTSWYAKRKKRLDKEVNDNYQAARIARRQAIKRADAARASQPPRQQNSSDDAAAADGS